MEAKWYGGPTKDDDTTSHHLTAIYRKFCKGMRLLTRFHRQSSDQIGKLRSQLQFLRKQGVRPQYGQGTLPEFGVSSTPSGTIFQARDLFLEQALYSVSSPSLIFIRDNPAPSKMRIRRGRRSVSLLISGNIVIFSVIQRTRCPVTHLNILFTPRYSRVDPSMAIPIPFCTLLFTR